MYSVSKKIVEYSHKLVEENPRRYLEENQSCAAETTANLAPARSLPAAAQP